jgi:hypothetical protein
VEHELRLADQPLLVVVVVLDALRNGLPVELLDRVGETPFPAEQRGLPPDVPPLPHPELLQGDQSFPVQPFLPYLSIR